MYSSVPSRQIPSRARRGERQGGSFGSPTFLEPTRWAVGRQVKVAQQPATCNFAGTANTYAVIFPKLSFPLTNKNDEVDDDGRFSGGRQRSHCKPTDSRRK
mmetsp:Transcript_5041/g.11407  ORF Transcript_5041/g.11407 Transcript_5041/m.11407 type:complete len:101 (+) Transcript_5041:99-401(+)